MASDFSVASLEIRIFKNTYILLYHWNLDDNKAILSKAKIYICIYLYVNVYITYIIADPEFYSAKLSFNRDTR